MKSNGQSNGKVTNGRNEVLSSEGAEVGSGKRARILIVEDEPAMVAGLRDNFEYEGYEVISAGDGVEGLDRALSENPDLVVLDVMMPGKNGWEVCRHLRQSSTTRHAAIIMVTAIGPKLNEMTSPLYGADDFVA